MVRTEKNKYMIVEKKFVEDIDKVDIEKVVGFKIPMINTNFAINFTINRCVLHNLMLKEKYNVKFEPGRHACVNIKHKSGNKLISIFVFERGPIIITGAQNCNQVADAYVFINKYLLSNYNIISKFDTIVKEKLNYYKDKFIAY